MSLLDKLLCINTQGLGTPRLIEEGHIYTFDGYAEFCKCKRIQITEAQGSHRLTASYCAQCDAPVPEGTRYSWFDRRFVPLNDKNADLGLTFDEITGSPKELVLMNSKIPERIKALRKEAGHLKIKSQALATMYEALLHRTKHG